MKVRGAMRRLVPLTLLIALIGTIGLLPTREAHADYNVTVNVADATVLEGAGGTTTNMVFTVSLTTKSQNDVTIVYNTTDGTAFAGQQYKYAAGSLVITAGTTSKTISVPVIGNDTPNGDKTFSMTLASATNAVLGVSTATGTIYDDDVNPVLTIESTAIARGAGGTSNVMTFPVLLSPASVAPVSVKFSTTNVSAIAGVDYAAKSGVVKFAPGVTQQTISITEFGKDGLAPDVTFSVNLTSPVNAQVKSGGATGTIQSDRPTSRLVIGDAGQVKPASSTVGVTVPVKLVPPSSAVVTVFVATSDGTAHAGTDYDANAATLTFNAGSSTPVTPFTVTVHSGGGAGTFGVSLSNASPGAVISNTSATVILQANGAAAPQFTVQDTAVVEGNTAAVTVALTNAAASTVSVTATTVDGTAKAGTDYTATGPTVETFTAGQSTKTFNVPISSDTIAQGNRSFTVSLSTSTGPTILRTSATVIILDDDLLAAVQMSDATQVRPTSGSAIMSFSVSLAAPSANTVTVLVSTSNGTAISTVHYTGLTNVPVVFNPGQVSKTVNVTILPNAANDVDRTFSLNVGTVTNGFASTTTTTGVILDTVAPSMISVTGVEAFACSKKMVFTVSLDHPSAVTIGVQYTTVDGSAKAGTDYTTASNTLTFTPGVTTQTVTVTVNQNPNAQADRNLTLQLSAPTNAVLSPNGGSANGILRNQNLTPGLTVSDGAVVEGAGGTSTQMVFTVSIVPAAVVATAITYDSADGSATSPTNYVGVSGTLNFAVGDTSKQVSVTINGDDAQNADRTFSLNVHAPPLPAPVIPVLRPTGTGTILDDDTKAIVHASPGAVQRLASGTKVLNVPVYLAPASNQAVSVQYTTTDGSATAPTDYTAVSGTLNFPAGSTTPQNVAVTVKSSATASTLTFSLSLSNAVNATIGKNSPTLTIFPSAGTPVPTAWVQAAALVEGDSGTANMAFTVGMAPAPATTTFVNFQSSSFSATAGVDYTPVQGTLTFNAGQTSKTINVPVKGDTIDERPNETVSITLSATGAGGVSVVDGSANGTIVGDDVTPVLDVVDAAVVEGNAGPVSMLFTFNIMPANPNDTSIDVLTADSTGTKAGRDYVTTSETVNFPAGTTTGSVAVPLIPNTTLNGSANPRFVLNLSNPIGLQNPHTSANGYIIDADTFNVTGAIKDGTGAAVSGAVVTSSKGQSGTSDASGNFVVPDNLNGSTFTVAASGGGRSYFPASSANIKLCGADVKQSFLALSGNYIEGQVTDTKGKALAGITVTRTGNAQPTVMATTDSNGFYGFSSNPNGTYTVTASKTGDTFAPPSYSAVISGAPSTTNDFIAMTGNTISGRVTLQSNGNPVAGVLVTASSAGHPNITFTTGPSGYYAMSGVAGSAGGVTWSVQPSKTGKTFTPPGAFLSVHNGDQLVQNFLSS